MRPLRATYRLQFSREFGFADAARLAPYLAQLGISHVYASPYLRARPGSTHGYDIVAHDQLNPELGSAADFAHMVAEFERHDLGQILDFVPNHMGVGGADNPLWLDVLEWGPESRFAGWFDIDWEPAAGYLTEKLLVPVLGEQYGAALEAGKLELKFDAGTGEFAVWAYDTHKLPINPLQYASILGSDHPGLERIGDEFSALEEWRPQVGRRAGELKAELALLCLSDAAAQVSLEARLERFNGAQDPARHELDELIRKQYWRASHFRVAGDDINYRRFFNINDLAGLRIELPDVFEHAHRLVARLLREGAIDGLRIDHVDGLLDPTEYLQRLRALALQPGGASRPFTVHVEKILASDEQLPHEWPIEGTTGYEFANLVLRALTCGDQEAALTRAYEAFTGESHSFAAVVRDSKFRILRNEMASELNVLARDIARAARVNPRTADFTRNLVRRAARATIACFPVYRTYLDPRNPLSEADRSRIARAIGLARGLERDIDTSVFDFLEALLTGDLVATPRSGFSRHAALRCAMKFQQLSGPVMAKGLEDTAFYRYHRLVSHNEVGGDPSTLAQSMDEFHAANAARLKLSPLGLLGTSTHDTKRGEDARMRLITLAEIPDEWSHQVTAWNREVAAESAALADRNLEYLLYQMLLGSWPATPPDATALEEFQRRIHGAMIKSARESRAHTSWSAPDEAFESALQALIAAVFRSPLRESIEKFAARIAEGGMRNSLAQTVLKLTVPGVPDLYQGAELWELSLVDPDNRRPVDYARRATMLEQVMDDWARDPAATLRRLATGWRNGGIKLLLTALLLAHRRGHAELYERGRYVPFDVPEPLGGFLRETATERLLVVFARHPLAHPQADARFTLPETASGWLNLLTNTHARGEVGFREQSQGLPVLVLASPA